MKKYIYIGAEWCGPCRVFKPKFESFCKSKNLEYEIFDADEDESKIEKYNIKNVPTIIIEENGSVIKKGTAMEILKKMENGEE